MAPIFTAAATALFAGTALAGTFAVSATAFGLQMAAGIGLSYAAQAIAGKPASQQQAAARVGGIQGKLQASGEVPRSFPIGDSYTAGSLTYANYWGTDGDTPNAYFTQVIALADLAIPGVRTYYVNAEAVTLLTGEMHADRGAPVQQYRKDGKDHLWIKFYDGTQTTADPFVANYVSNAERPYGPDRIGYGVAYAICTFLVNDELFGKWPEYGFALQSVRWYDPSRDSSVGGVGTQRWGDRSTWGGDGDNLPAVQAYNVMRGITFEGQWLYGLQNISAAQLPIAAAIEAINACRDQIEREDGLEPTYRAAHECRVNTRIDDTIEVLMTACHGKMSETGGFYKMRVGRPGAPVLSFTDADIIGTEEQSFVPFFGLAETINGVTGTYPVPEEGWSMKAAPALLVPELEARDGNRRLLADVRFDAVPYAAQVQHLMQSALEEAQRARRHTHVMPPRYWILEPGDVVSWTSVEHGYVDKLFRVDGGADRANLDILLDLTEIDPNDHSWNQSVDFTPVPRNPIGFVRPAAQGIVDWFAEPAIIYDQDGLSRRPAIRLAWDGSVVADIAAVQYEVRNDFDAKDVIYRGRTEMVGAGSVRISQNLIPDEDYEVRGRYIPANPRDTLWSGWLKVTTPDVRIGERDITQSLLYNLTELLDTLDDRLLRLESSQVAANSAARAARDNIRLRGQTVKMVDRVELKVVENLASIEEVRELAISNEGSIASLTTSVETRFSDANALIETNAEAISTVDIAFSSYRTTTTAQLGDLTASVEVTQEAIAGVGAKHTILTDVDGNVAGTQLINGGPGLDAFSVITSNFQIVSPASPGVPAVKPFVVGSINGQTKIGIRADQVLIDASVYARHLTAGSVNAGHIQSGSIGTNQLSVGGVDVLNLIAGAATKVTSYDGGYVAMTAQGTLFTLVDSGGLNFPVACNTVFLASMIGNGGSPTSPIPNVGYPSEASNITFGIYVDDALVPGSQRTFTFSLAFGAGIYFPPPNFFDMVIIGETVVPAGFHTVKVKASYVRFAQGSTDPSSPVVASSTKMIVTQNRR